MQKQIEKGYIGLLFNEETINVKKNLAKHSKGMQNQWKKIKE